MIRYSRLDDSFNYPNAVLNFLLKKKKKLKHLAVIRASSLRLKYP